jgi:hypothetical protein
VQVVSRSQNPGTERRKSPTAAEINKKKEATKGRTSIDHRERETQK